MRRRFNVEPKNDSLYFEPATGKTWCRDDFRVLYADTDKAGVVYHANYLRYFEIGRATLIRTSGLSYKEIEDTGVFQPIIDLGITYEFYAEYDELLDVYASPRNIAPVKFSYDYVVMSRDHNRVVVHGYTEHCCIDKVHHPIPVDPVTRELFAKFGVARK